MEIKQEQDVKLCGVNKKDMEAQVTEITDDVPNNSAPIQDYHPDSEEFKVKLDDEIPELDALRNTDVKKVLNNAISNKGLKRKIRRRRHIQDVISFGRKEGNCSCTKCPQSNCHVGVEQKDMKNVYNTQQSDLIKHDVLSESMSDHESISKNRNNIKLRTTTVKQILTRTTESVHDSDCQTMNADIVTNQIDDNVKFPQDNKGSLLKHGVDDSNQPVLHLSTDTDRRLSTEIFKCTVCHVEFTDSDKLMAHKQIHTGDFTIMDYHKKRKVEKTYICRECGFFTTRNGDLRQHKRTHTGEKPFRCDVCGLDFRQRAHLIEHTRIHTGEKPYGCDICGSRFTQNGNLLRHIKIHTGERPYKCDVCGFCFTDSSALKKHNRIHTGDKPYKCDVCYLSFARNNNLIMHKRLHTGEKPCRCDVCGLCFTYTTSLERHKRTHTGEKPFTCDVCGFRFAQSGHLLRHSKVHTGEKPFKCDVCGFCFTDNSSLKRHKSKHAEEKLYKCGVCGICFTDSSSLSVHTIIHTAEEPFKCDVCDFCFPDNSSLKSHKSKHAEEKLYKCDVCGFCFTDSSSLSEHKMIIHTG